MPSDLGGASVAHHRPLSVSSSQDHQRRHASARSVGGAAALKDGNSAAPHSSLNIGPPSPLQNTQSLDAGADVDNTRRSSTSDEGHEYVRTYEAGEPVLPTSASQLHSSGSANSGIFLQQQQQQRAPPQLNPSGTSRFRNQSHIPVAEAYGIYSGSASTPSPGTMNGSLYKNGDASYMSHGGEDKVAEKENATNGIRNMSEKGTTASMNPATSSYPGHAYASSQMTQGAGGGKYAKLIPEQRPPQSPLEYVRWFFANEVCVLIMYTILSLFTRIWRIGKNASVVWDEAHFGKFGSHYLKHEFYFDVHPPLGKMLVGLAGLLSGYNGHFEFKSGEQYPNDVNYVGMRVILAMFGVAMVPLAYSTSGALGWNWRTRHALAVMVLLDNAWLVISRFILLDSMLLFFTFTTVHGLVMLHSWQFDSFGDMWWFWLTFTGLSIGCVASVKWVGLFATALVGLYTIEDLWNKFGDLKMPVRRYVRHWCARTLCLIVLPISVYMASFKMHFLILNRSGPGDAQMSSLFQAHLKGNNIAQAPLQAAYGSKVTFKNMGYGGGLLHSHVQTYPVGSQQQQVTCYHYRDNNNDFIITPTWGEAPVNESEEPRMVRSGSVVRFVHEATSRNLHSHNVPAPVTKENLEVSGYGNATIGDSNDHWVIEVVDDMVTGKKGKLGDPVKSLTTRLRFRHQALGCYMRAANAILPQWGWKQVEVSCDKENNPKDEHTYWNIETHVNERLPMGNAKLYRSPFLRDFLHLNVAMMTSNNALIPDQDKEDILASKPLDWPWLYNGLRMNGWGDHNIKYYLVGNPIVWWGSTASMIVYALTYLWYKARAQRRVIDLSPHDWNQFTFVGKVAGLGYVLHFAPFLLMARVCYIHHYLPTLYFAVLMFAHLLDHFLWNGSTARYVFSSSRRSSSASGNVRQPLSEVAKNATFFIFIISVATVFWWFRETAWGIEGPIWQRWGIKWRKTWNIKD